MKRLVLGFFCFGALQVIAAAAYAQQGVKIGMIMTYTGQFTDAAAQMDNGIKLYIKQHGDVVAGKKPPELRMSPNAWRRNSSSTTTPTSSQVL